MRIHPLIILPAAYLVFRGVSKGYGASRLGYRIVKLVPRGFIGLSVAVDLHLAVQNPTGEMFEIKSLTADVFANGNAIGNISSFTLTGVKPNSETVMVVSIRMPLSALANQVWNAIQGGVTSISQEIKISGTVNVNGLPLPFNASYKIL